MDGSQLGRRHLEEMWKVRFFSKYYGIAGITFGFSHMVGIPFFGSLSLGYFVCVIVEAIAIANIE